MTFTVMADEPKRKEYAMSNNKRNWMVFSNGPIPTIENMTVAEAKKYVESNAHLKKGWTGKWVTVRALTYRYERYNSKGAHQKSLDIGLVAESLVKASEKKQTEARKAEAKKAEAPKPKKIVKRNGSQIKYDWQWTSSDGKDIALEWMTPVEAKYAVQNADSYKGRKFKWDRNDHLDYTMIVLTPKGNPTKAFKPQNLIAVNEYV